MIESSLFGIILLIIGLIIKYSNIPMNSLFGYRTPMAMKSNRHWELANRAFAIHAILIGVISILIGNLNGTTGFHSTWIMFINLSLLLLSIVVIERKLHKFNRQIMP